MPPHFRNDVTCNEYIVRSRSGAAVTGDHHNIADNQPLVGAGAEIAEIDHLLGNRFILHFFQLGEKGRG